MDTQTRAWADDEIGSIYVERTDRFVVSLVVSYYGDELMTDPKQAAAAALDLTRDGGSDGTYWFVYDRRTETMHQFEQSEFEGVTVP